MSNLLPTYNRINLSFTHGQGAWLFGSDKKKYLDFTSGVAVNALGHSHPKLVKALCEQGQKLWHVSNLYEIPEQIKLAKKLCNLTNYSQAFFANSGTEANEAALKLARKATGKIEIFSFTGSFHGRTMGSLSLTAKENIRKDFLPLLAGCEILPWGDIKTLEKKAGPKTAAVIFEFCQGEGGVNLINKKFLAAIFRLARKYKFLTISDEVQTGVGRSGEFLASQKFKVKPDIATLAKGLGGGFPIGALLTRTKIGANFSAGSHGSTFGGSPLASAVALAAISEIGQAKFLKNVKNNSDYFFKKLEELQKKYPKIIQEARGLGFLLGLEIYEAKTRDLIIKTLREEYQILTTSSGEKTLRILPPLIASGQEISWFLLKLEDALKKL